jgi:magnesium-transporting ATPase (P-type)
MILYFFYKNMILTTAQFIYLFYNGFSGQTIYDDWYISFYNLAFTSFPLIVRALFDKDIYYKYWGNTPTNTEGIATSTLLKDYYPFLYYVGQQSTIFTLGNALRWIIVGLGFGAGLFLITLYALNEEAIVRDGYMADMWFVSILNYTTIVLVVDLKLGMHTKTWTWMNWFSLLVLSLTIYFAYTFVGDVLTFFNSNRTVAIMYTSPHYWLLQGLFVVGAFLYDQCALIYEKEFSTPLSILYRSIRERYTSAAEVYFSRVIKYRDQVKKASVNKELEKSISGPSTQPGVSGK